MIMSSNNTKYDNVIGVLSSTLTDYEKCLCIKQHFDAHGCLILTYYTHKLYII